VQAYQKLTTGTTAVGLTVYEIFNACVIYCVMLISTGKAPAL